MKETLLIIADLGTFKAFKVFDDPASSRPRLQRVNAFDMVAAHGRLSDKLTDKAGRFPGKTRDARPYGERHNIKLEFQRRILADLARHTEETIRSEGANGFNVCLALPGDMKNQLLDKLTPEIRRRIEWVIPENLANTPDQELPGHLDHARPLH